MSVYESICSEMERIEDSMYEVRAVLATCKDKFAKKRLFNQLYKLNKRYNELEEELDDIYEDEALLACVRETF